MAAVSEPSRRDRLRAELPGLLLGLMLGLALCGLAAWQLDWLGAGLWDPINHGENEDWDWQLTMYEATRTAVMDHRQIPGWTPWTQGGVPLWANPEFPGLYPLFWLIPALGTSAGLKVWTLLHLWLLVLGGYVGGRTAGLSPVASHGAALLTICSAFVPGFIAYGHIMYLPLGWLPIAWALQRSGRWAWAGAALAMTFLAGGHYLLLYGALWLGLDGLLRALSEGGGAARLRPLAAALLLNGLLLGQSWAAWPLGLGLLAACAWAARGASPTGLVRSLAPVAGAGALAGLLLASKLTTAPALFERAERLTAQLSLSVADPYTPALAWAVLTGAAERLSGHEGQNVFWSGVPVVLGLGGLALAGWRRPALGVMGLTWWCLGWGGSTPVNLLEALHRLPGFELIRVVERYSLVWTLFLGWGAGLLVDEAWRRWRPATAAPLGLLVYWVIIASPRAATDQRLGPGRHSQVPAGDFVQVEDELSNYEAVRANRGKLDCWTTAWLADPSPALRPVGHPEYRGEAWRLETGEALPVSITPSVITVDMGPRGGTAVINQNAFRGWTADGAPAGSHEGLLSAPLGPGERALSYRPPGLPLGAALSLVGLAALFGFARSRAPGPAASSRTPPP